MKFTRALVLTLAASGSIASMAGCSSAPRTEPAASSAPDTSDGRAFVERLRVDTSWHPVATGAECVNAWYELPPHSYIAQGWPCYWSYSRCARTWGIPWGHSRGAFWARGCHPIGACVY